jgi:DMSO reductase anchor subunit
MSTSDVTKDGLQGIRPDREALVGTNAGRSPRSEARKRARKDHLSMVGEPTFTSYYGKPILNKPTWEPLDIAGYLFLGGLAGSSSALAAIAELTGRPGLGRPLKLGAAGGIGLSLIALVHDLGRPSRFANMLRVFKPTSPMSVGSWLLSAYAPAAFAAAGTEVLGRWRPAGKVATLAAALVGPAVASYTAVLIADTAVPAWHDGYRDMPFVFVGSAASAGAGLGLLTSPLADARPARRLGPVAAAVELGMARRMRSRMGLASETYEQGRAGTLVTMAEVLTAAGAVTAVVGRRSRLASALAGVSLLAGSAFLRFGIFHAGVQSAEDPRYTVEPQRQRLDERAQTRRPRS